MGRARCEESVYFTYKEKTPKKRRNYVECNYCIAAHAADPNLPSPEILKSRKEVFQRHLAACPHRAAAILLEDAQPGYVPVLRGPPSKWTASDFAVFTRLVVDYQHGNRLPDRYIENDVTTRLYEFLCPGITPYLPSRRTLGGRMLNEVANECLAEEIELLKAKQDLVGGRVNLLSDAWQNISKHHLLACQLSLLGELHTFSITKVGSSHDGVTIAEDLEGQMKLVLEAGWNLGAVVTDNAGQCARARRILALRWPGVVFLHCFAHDINNLVRSVLNSSFKKTARSAAKAVNALNASSAKWLVRVQDEMKDTYGDVWSLLALCETRWNSMQACFASLLRVRSALKAFHDKHQSKRDFPQPAKIFGRPFFWRSLQDAEKIIRPLSYASYKLQRDENTVANVLDCYGIILLAFLLHHQYGETLVACVEKRWAACEQPIFILGYFLHPDYFSKSKLLRESRFFNDIDVAHFAVYYFRRLIGGDPGVLFGDFIKWREGRLTTTPITGFRRWEDYWLAVDKELRLRSELSLRKEPCLLPRLAITILSIAVNTATCERLFSELGLIHTSLRNQMCSKKARKIHAVRKGQRDRIKRAQPRDVEPIVHVKKLIDPTEKVPNEARIRALRQQEDVDRPQPQVELPENSFEPDDPVDLLEMFLAEVSLNDLEAEFDLEDEASELVIDGMEAIDGATEDSWPQAGEEELRKNFPQESSLTGLRSAKVNLTAIFRQ